MPAIEPDLRYFFFIFQASPSTPPSPPPPTPTALPLWAMDRAPAAAPDTAPEGEDRVASPGRQGDTRTEEEEDRRQPSTTLLLWSAKRLRALNREEGLFHQEQGVQSGEED